MPIPPFIPAQQPDAAIGRRYSKAFKYVFALLKVGEDLTSVDPNDKATSVTSLIDEGRFVVLTLLRELQMRGPFATAITVMQDGGKVIESAGHVLRPVTLSGTTGFLPPGGAVPLQPTFGRLVPNVFDIDGQLGAISGYLAFQKLNYLFDLYGDERRRGNLDLKFHFFDYKNDSFWRIEPGTFDMSRSSRRPMSYEYNVQFNCIERADAVVSRDEETGVITGVPGLLTSNARVNTSNAGGVLAKIAGALSAASKSSIVTAVSRFGDMVTSGLDFLKHCDAVVQRAFQATLNKLDAVVGFFANVHDTFFTLLEVVPTLMAQLSSSLAGLFDTISKFAPDNIAQELNAWALEVTTLSDHMAVQVGSLVASQAQRDVRDTDQRFSQGRMKRGATTDLMQEPAGGAGAPDANPFVGASGLSLVTDVDGLAGSSRRVAILIHNGEDIYSLARRVFGKAERFSDIVLLNKLEFPFLVADVATKPSNTLAWGEYVLVPAPSSGANAPVADGADASAVPTTSGTIDTASLPSQVIDSGASWLPGQWIGYSVTAVTGGDRQTLICNANTINQLTLDGNLTITVTPGVTTYAVAYTKFDPRRPVTAETRAYGVDLLAVFGTDGRCDAALGATGDLATARGLDNFFQAITLRARCPIGEHPFHRSYGMATPVGRPFTDDVGVLYSFAVRRSLLSDPRVSKVRNVQLDLRGDTVTASLEVQPVNARNARPINIQVGA
jgi:hypothetical protein